MGDIITSTFVRDFMDADTIQEMRDSLGITNVGNSIFQIPDVAQISYLRINADNSVDALTASQFLAAIGGNSNSTIEITGAVVGSGTSSINVSLVSGISPTKISGTAATLSSTNTFAEGVNMAFGTVTGTTFGTTTSQKIGFWGHTPTAQPSAISNPTSGSVQDDEARAAIISILSTLRQMGILPPYSPSVSNSPSNSPSNSTSTSPSLSPSASTSLSVSPSLSPSAPCPSPSPSYP